MSLSAHVWRQKPGNACELAEGVELGRGEVGSCSSWPAGAARRLPPGVPGGPAPSATSWHRCARRGQPLPLGMKRVCVCLPSKAKSPERISTGVLFLCYQVPGTIWFVFLKLNEY